MKLRAPFDLDTVTCPVCLRQVRRLTPMHCCPGCEDADLRAQRRPISWNPSWDTHPSPSNLITDKDGTILNVWD